MPSKNVFIDPWLKICECYPHPDCVRLKGDYQASFHTTRTKPAAACPITKAVERGWCAEKAAENRAALELLEPIIWGEW